MTNRLVIKEEFTDLNTYINKERANRFLGAKVKKDNTEKAFYYFVNLKSIKTPVKFIFHWYLPNYRKDPDNISFAKKFILDGMVKAGFIPNDNLKNISGFGDEFYIDKENPRVEIEVR